MSPVLIGEIQNHVLSQRKFVPRYQIFPLPIVYYRHYSKQKYLVLRPIRPQELVCTVFFSAHFLSASKSSLDRSGTMSLILKASVLVAYMFCRLSK